MCLTPTALMAFLALLPLNVVETQGDTVTVHAEAGDVIWVAEDDLWCTDLPAKA